MSFTRHGSAQNAPLSAPPLSRKPESFPLKQVQGYPFGGRIKCTSFQSIAVDETRSVCLRDSGAVAPSAPLDPKIKWDSPALSATATEWRVQPIRVKAIRQL